VPPGLPVGSEAPAFELPDLAGERKSLAGFRGQPALLLFFNPSCGFCREMAPKLAILVQRSSRQEQALSEKREIRTPNSEIDPGHVSSAATPRPIIISTGEAQMNRQLFDEHKLGCTVLLQTDAEVATAYQAHGTPSGYLIDAEGRIASDLTIGAEALLELFDGKAARTRATRADQVRN